MKNSVDQSQTSWGPRAEAMLCLPDFVEEMHEVVVDHECDCNVQSDTAESGHRTFVKSAQE